MMKILKTILLSITLLLLLSQAALAIPTFQVASPDYGTPGDSEIAEDTWLITDTTFELVVVGAYQAGDSKGVGATAGLTYVTLVVSVPEYDLDGGTITITGGDGAILLTTKMSVDDGYFNPNADATLDLLTNEPGIDGYDDKSFLPDDQTLDNQHSPFKPGVSNFLIYGLGDFDPDGEIHNYNADTDDPDYVPPPIPLTAGSLGEEKTFTVTVSGFDWVHFDVYGYESYVDGSPSQLQSTWMLSANSHDATYIPAPGAILLGSIGVGLVGWLRRRKTL